MSDANALNIPSIGPISNTATGTFSSSYNKFYQPGWANIGISLSGTTFTVSSEAGTAYSATNPGFVALQSLANPGQIKRYSVTANQSFTQAGLGNNLFGVTTAVNWAQDVPFYLYAVSNANNGENAIAFMISRIPHATVSPVAGKIAQSGNTNSTTQGSFFSLAAVTAADYASSPCVCLGSFRQQYASSLWTVQTLKNSDGVGQYNDSTIFSFVSSQLGAAAGSFFASNGGTAPIWTAQTVNYQILKNGQINYLFDTNASSTSQNGAGAVTLQAILPLVYKLNSVINGSGFWANNGSTEIAICFFTNPTLATTICANIRIWSGVDFGAILSNSSQTGTAVLRLQFSYIADLA